MISIITVNWNSYDFLNLLIESLDKFSSIPYELIVIDNSQQREHLHIPHVTQIFMPTNIGHGRGLNYGVHKAYELFPRHQFIMFLDVDCHILTHYWENAFIAQMRSYDIIGGRGVECKPIRPACMFMKREIGKYDWADSEGYRGNRITPEGFDVGIKAYYKIMVDNHKIGFLESTKNRYGTLNGEEWCLFDMPLIYHHWHGASLHLPERQADFPGVDLFADKALLFSKIPWRMP